MPAWEGFSGLNRGYVLELYDRFRKDPQSVDPETRALFEQWTPPADLDDEPQLERQRVGAANRCRRGQPGAVDPPLRPSRRPARSARLAAARRSDAPAATHGLTEEDLRRLPANLIPSPLCEGRSNMQELVAAFRRALLLDDRLRLRARLRARGAPVAPPGRRGRALPRAGRSDQPGRAARPADRRSRRSSVSCTAPSPARRASRSKGSTCSCRSSTK